MLEKDTFQGRNQHFPAGSQLQAKPILSRWQSSSAAIAVPPSGAALQLRCSIQTPLPRSLADRPDVGLTAH